MDMNLILLIGQIFFGGYFLIMGINHLKNVSGMTMYATSKSVPLPKVAVIATGILLTLAGLGVILGFYIWTSLMLIAIFLFFTTLMMHRFWKETDPTTKESEKQAFLRNVAFLGAALMLIALV